MANLWRAFDQLLPSVPTQVGTITAHNADGTSLVDLPGGGQLIAQGQTVAVGAKAFVKEGRVVGEAPALALVVIDV